MSTEIQASRWPAHRQLPVPLDPAAAQGPQWLRGPRPGDATDSGDGAGTPVETGSELEAVPVPTVQDVRASAIKIVVDLDAAIAGLQAMRTHALAGLGLLALEEAGDAHLDAGIVMRDLANELALRQRRSDRTVEAEIDRAMRTLDEWPATLRAWGETRIHQGHLRVITDIGAPLKTPEARAQFEAALLPVAETTTPARLAKIARRELEKLVEEPLVERHRIARDGREVFVTDLADAMSKMVLYIPTVLAHGILDRATEMARAAGDDDPRTVDQRRADACCDLLLTGEPTDPALAGIRAQVSIVIPATVLLGDDGNDTGDSARLRSGALVDPDTARWLDGVTKTWTRVFTDPVKGHVIATDTYKPSRQVRRLLRERDQRCRWPGCCAKAEHADIDHTIPWADGGTTTPGNLAHLCRRHHMLKGAVLPAGRRWKVTQLEPGVLRFESPMGAVYVDEPEQVGPRFTESYTEWLWRGTFGPAPQAPF
ncbi:hypothetical protein ABIB37_002706 [Agrococcus sp. UYP10]|uniref:HNH endonuclease signature motif containing protein n=1 Tax=Agrococcus sp. UYP10 TaxID=1756355 RepID=UPI003395ADAB